MELEIRDYDYNNIVTLVLFLPIVFVFFMCLLDLRKSKLFFNTFFSNKYFYSYPVDLTNFVSLYSSFILVFISLVTTIFLLLITKNSNEIYTGILDFYPNIFLVVLVYSFFKIMGGKFLSYLFKIKDLHKQMLVLETSYLASVMLLSYPVFGYSLLQLNSFKSLYNVVLLSVLFLYCFRIGMLMWNNKNLVSGQILYIILYLCTLEILPFIYFIKRYTE